MTDRSVGRFIFRPGKRSAVIGACVVVALLAACVPPKQPPPPPSGPRDVVVVGDSLSYSFGCVLGDNAGSGDPCPAPPDFTTRNAYQGACNIGGGTLLTYNGGIISNYNCSNWPAVWSQVVNEHHPKVVVMITSGWEIVDRWSDYPSWCNPIYGGDCPVAPDLQWGGGDYSAARDNYAANLIGAIGLFQSLGVEHVLVSNAPYARPREPFSTNGVPYWYERHQDDGGSGASGFQDWVPPSQAPGYTYRPGKTKVTQLNTTTAAVVDSFGGNGVRLFDFFSHFDPGGEYSDYICPPPNDGVPPNLFLQCPGGQSALLARDPDGSHLTLPPGGHDILEHYLRPCVRGLLGIAGGNVNTCS